jgi:hypothetical protein
MEQQIRYAEPCIQGVNFREWLAGWPEALGCALWAMAGMLKGLGDMILVALRKDEEDA